MVARTGTNRRAPLGRVAAGSGAREPGTRRDGSRLTPRELRRRRRQNNDDDNDGDGGGRRRRRSGQRGYGAYGSYAGVPRKRAKRLVAAEIREGINDIRKDKRVIRREARNDRTRAETLYQRSVGDLEHIFGESGRFIEHQRGQMNQNYDQQADRSAAAQSALLDHLKNNSAGNAAQTGSELDRMGISGTGSMDRFAADANFSENTAIQTGANNQANIDFLKTSGNTVSDLIMGMNAGSQASNMGRVLNTRNDQMFEIQQNSADANNKILEAMSDLRGQRGDLTRQLLEQLDSSQWGKFMDMQGLRQQRRQNRRRRRSGGGSSGGGNGTWQPAGGNGNGGGGGGGNGSFSELALNALNSPNRNRRRRRR